MWVAYLLSFVAGLIGSLPAISLVAGLTLTILLIESTDLWVAGETPVAPTASMVWPVVGETALAVLPAAAMGLLLHHLIRRARKARRGRRG